MLAIPVGACGATVTERFGGRSLIVYVPAHLPAAGARALVVVLHGGLGNAERIATARSESALNLNAEAEAHGFIVAYLNGTPVTRFGDQMLGWNAGGGCCGQSAANDVDDVGYIQGAVRRLEGEYGVDPGRVFGIGHSNGAMMTQRLMCRDRPPCRRRRHLRPAEPGDRHLPGGARQAYPGAAPARTTRTCRSPAGGGPRVCRA